MVFISKLVGNRGQRNFFFEVVFYILYDIAYKLIVFCFSLLKGNTFEILVANGVKTGFFHGYAALGEDKIFFYKFIYRVTALKYRTFALMLFYTVCKMGNKLR